MIRVLLALLIFAMPAMADNFSNNQSGVSSCTVDIVGSSSAPITATANYSPISVTCAAGTYLPADGVECATCLAGYYCPGGTYTYNETTAQGATACSASSDTFILSDSGTSSTNGCYANVSCPTITSNANCDSHAATCAYANDASTSGRYYSNQDSTIKCNMTFTCATGYTLSTTQSAPTIPNQAGNSYEWRSHDSSSISANGASLSTGEWAVVWSSGVLKGVSSCSAIAGNSNHWLWNTDSSNWTLPANTNVIDNSVNANDPTRYFCWCKPTAWTPNGESAQPLSVAWFFQHNQHNAIHCAAACASLCAYNVSTDSNIRTAMLSTIGNSKQCDANTINIQWDDGNGGYTAGTCSYGGSITTPTTAPTKRGHVFTGWTFDVN